MDSATEARVIQAYLEKHRLSQAAFARKVGVTQGMVWQWTQGLKRVSPQRAKDIETATEGGIKRHALRPDLFDAPLEAPA